MRTLLAGELTQAQSEDSDYYVKLEVQNGSGTWKDVGALLGRNWIINASYGESVDTPVGHATFTLVQEIDGDSLAPLMSGSALNVDDASAYSPLLDIGRLVRASVATMASGVSLDTGKYREVFTGRIDSVEGTDSLAPIPIVIQCSDLGAWLMDMQIEVEGRQYGSDVGVALETTIQAVLDDNIPATEPSVTLVKESSSSFNVTGYAQGATKVLEGCVTLVLDSVGEDIRYRYDSSHVSQFMWFDPDRSRSTVDATFTAEQYRVQKLDISIRDIRNAGELPYIDSTTGAQGVVSSEAGSSITAYRRRFFRLPSSKLVTNSTDAQAVIDAVVNDLSGPIADYQAVIPYFWPAQLFDRYTFSANGRTYDDDQTFGITGIQHTIENGKGTTVLQCAGRIVGAYAEWLKRIPATPPQSLDITVPPLLSYSVRTDADTQISYLTAKVQGGPGTYVTRALARIDREPSGDELDAGTPSTVGVRTGVFTDICELKAGKRFYVAGRAYNEAGEGTAVARISEVWLGIDSTPGADVEIGSIVSQADQIIYPVAFDNECAYCEIWSREFTTNPGSAYSVENLSSAPFRVLSLGDDAMVPGVAQDVSIPIAGPDNWLLTTFVPFDHLGKRGNVQTKRTQGSRGTIVDTDPTTILDLKLWWDPTQDNYASGDPLTTLTDFSGNGNTGTEGHSGTDVVTASLEGNVQNGNPVFQFQGNSTGTDSWVQTSSAVLDTLDGAFLIFVAKRYGAHQEHTIFTRFNGGMLPGVAADQAQCKETHNLIAFPSDNGMVWHTAAGGDVIISTSDTSSDFFIHAVKFSATAGASITSALQYWNGTAEASTFDPNPDADGSVYFSVGTGWIQYGDIMLAAGEPTAQQLLDIFTYLSDKWFTSSPLPPADPAPDPPTAASQIDSTIDSVTVRVTMPASAPDYIRITVGGTRVYDEAVTVAGSATQDFVITDLGPNTPYPIDFQSVVGGLVSTKLSITATTDNASATYTLDPPTITGVSYSTGDQQIIVTATAGANNPARGTLYLVSTSTNVGGPFTGSSTGKDFGSGITVLVPYAQTVSDTTVYVRIIARRVDWVDSTYDSSSVVVPAR